MDASELDRDEFVELMAREILLWLRAHLFPEKYMIQLRELRALSEKLVYLHLLYNQPQSFTSIRRKLGLGSHTVARALKRLRTKGLVVQDPRFLYWVKELEPRYGVPRTNPS